MLKLDTHLKEITDAILEQELSAYAQELWDRRDGKRSGETYQMGRRAAYNTAWHEVLGRVQDSTLRRALVADRKTKIEKTWKDASNA